MPMEIINHIDISKSSRMPVYQQIVDSIINIISNGSIELNQKLPSINMISEDFYLSRNTVERAYGILKERDIIVSVPRRGYYVANLETTHKLKVLFLINELSACKMKIYNSFVDKIGVASKVDLVVYHCDELVFNNTLKINKATYDYYVIIPHFKTENFKHISFTDGTLKAINNIPKSKLILLDNIEMPLNDSITAVYQEFDIDIYKALNGAVNKIVKYKRIVLIYPEKTEYSHPRRILSGFRKFCYENIINFEILNEVSDDIDFIKGDLFITIEDFDLINLINQIRNSELKLGEDIGVISYNDTPFKELLGIAAISTDYKVMGGTAAEMILNNKKGRVKVPFNFIDRKSI